MFDINNNSHDAFDPEFLTFRHNNQQAQIASVRSIYSQRFDYKSLQKYPIFELSNSEHKDLNQRTHKKIKNTTKQKNLRTVKSQEKYHQFSKPQNHNVEQRNSSSSQNQLGYTQPSRNSYTNCSKQQQKYYQTPIKHKKQQKCTKINQQQLQKNINLKSKLNKLIHNIKRQQKKQNDLDNQISQLTQHIQNYSKQIEQQLANIMELQQISQQNTNECNRIIVHINKTTSKNQKTALRLQNLQKSVDSSQLSIQTSRQYQLKDKLLHKKYKQNIFNLQKIKKQGQTRISKLQEQIKYLQLQIQQQKNNQNQLLRLFGFCQYTTQMFSRSQSYGSSTASNRQSIYY